MSGGGDLPILNLGGLAQSSSQDFLKDHIPDRIINSQKPLIGNNTPVKEFFSGSETAESVQQTSQTSHTRKPQPTNNCDPIPVISHDSFDTLKNEKCNMFSTFVQREKNREKSKGIRCRSKEQCGALLNRIKDLMQENDALRALAKRVLPKFSHNSDLCSSSVEVTGEILRLLKHKHGLTINRTCAIWGLSLCILKPNLMGIEIIYASPQFCAVTGYSSARLFHNYFETLPTIADDYHKCAKVRAAIIAQQDINVEVTIIHAFLDVAVTVKIGVVHNPRMPDTPPFVLGKVMSECLIVDSRAAWGNSKKATSAIALAAIPDKAIPKSERIFTQCSSTLSAPVTRKSVPFARSSSSSSFASASSDSTSSSLAPNIQLRIPWGRDQRIETIVSSGGWTETTSCNSCDEDSINSYIDRSNMDASGYIHDASDTFVGKFATRCEDEVMKNLCSQTQQVIAHVNQDEIEQDRGESPLFAFLHKREDGIAYRRPITHAEELGFRTISTHSCSGSATQARHNPRVNDSSSLNAVTTTTCDDVLTLTTENSRCLVPAWDEEFGFSDDFSCFENLFRD